MINDHYFEEGGPILIFVGGEWEISPAKLQNGLIVDIAEEYGGVLFYTEHRFYGESKPTKYVTIISVFLHPFSTHCPFLFHKIVEFLQRFEDGQPQISPCYPIIGRLGGIHSLSKEGASQI